MKDRIARYIATDLLNQSARAIADDEDLLGSGLLDSLSVISLVHFIEQEASIEIPAEDVTIDNFISLQAMDAYIARQLSFRAERARSARGGEESQSSR